MRVLLVKPNSGSDSIVPPLGLGYLAAGIRGRHQVRILNCLARNLGLEQFLLAVRRFSPDVVGIQMYSSDRDVSREYLQALSRKNRRPILLVGGPHPSSVPESVLDEFSPYLDYAFAGESEIGFKNLIDALDDHERQPDLRQIPGLIYRGEGGQVLVNPPRFIDDVDRFGQPSWDMLKPENYPHAPFAAFVRQLPVAPVVASRGCPHRCTFCAAGMLSGYRVRYRSPEKIVDEIELLYKVHGIREIQFADDNLTADPKTVSSICKLIIERGMDISWSCPNGVRTETLSRSLLEQMHESGCHSLAFGIETGSRRLLRMVRKDLNPDRIHRVLEMVRNTGIMTVGYFIMGLPTETAEDRRQTVKWSLALPLDLVNYMLYCPLPGTSLLEKARSSGNLSDAGSYHFASTIYVPEGSTAASLRRDQRLAFLRFYSRPRQMALLASAFHSPDHMRYILQRIGRWMLGITWPRAAGSLDGWPDTEF